MKNTWVLSIKTSLPDVCYKVGELSAKVYTFDSFEEAKAAARKVMKSYAFSKNAMFDGDGNLIHMCRYIDECLDFDENGEEFEEDLTKKKLIAVEKALRKMFGGEEVQPEFPEGTYTDWMIAYHYGNGELRFYGDDDGPCNGYDPTLRTNMFSMKEEKNYFLYIDDLFGQNEATAELYIDLVKAESFEK